jgi:hypothetical protein
MLAKKYVFVRLRVLHIAGHWTNHNTGKYIIVVIALFFQGGVRDMEMNLHIISVNTAL